mmetsp:Transcript_13995/g.13806  ORF Transcript_13995/g.13806 Transcript_13995/m.13806 type:complete len:87 (+) Transcript_13995:361-621(+)
MQTYKRIHKNVEVTSFSSRISKEWKVLSDDERNKWKKIAEHDKLRYNVERSLYKGPWRVPVKSEKSPKVSVWIFMLVLKILSQRRC